jgi:acyl carrier protein
MEQQFLEVITEALEIKGREILLTDNFKEFDEWDSLTQLTLIAELDDNFGVSIATADLNKINKLQELLDYIQSKRS